MILMSVQSENTYQISLEEETDMSKSYPGDKNSTEYPQELSDNVDEVVGIYDNKLTSGQIDSNDFWQKYLMPLLLRLQKYNSAHK
jgi:hypothetical protein